MPEATVAGKRLYYEDRGEGPAIAFLSGLGGDHRAFSVTTRHYAAAGWRALALDARDAGRSDRVNAPYTTADLADDVAGWLDGLGIDAAWLVGHSLGGLVAQEVAFSHPGRIRGLVLASTHARANTWRRAVIDSWIQAKRLCDPAEFARATLPWLAAPAFFEISTQVEGMYRFAERNDFPQDAAAFERQARAAFGHDSLARLSQVRVPCLVVSGMLDLVNPPNIARELADGIPGARLVLMPGVGHLPHIEDGPAFRAAIDAFLESNR